VALPRSIVAGEDLTSRTLGDIPVKDIRVSATWRSTPAKLKELVQEESLIPQKPRLRRVRSPATTSSVKILNATRFSDLASVGSSGANVAFEEASTVTYSTGARRKLSH
jgi:hypothetical protein